MITAHCMILLASVITTTSAMAEDKDVFRMFSDEITKRAYLASDEEFVILTKGFFKEGMISEVAQNEYARQRKVGELFTAVSLYVNFDKANRLERALKVMEECHPLKDIVGKMRQGFVLIHFC